MTLCCRGSDIFLIMKLSSAVVVFCKCRMLAVVHHLQKCIGDIIVFVFTLAILKYLIKRLHFMWNNVKEPSLRYYLCITVGRIVEFIPFLRELVLCEMQAALSRIWTQVVKSISSDAPQVPPFEYFEVFLFFHPLKVYEQLLQSFYFLCIWGVLNVIQKQGSFYLSCQMLDC